MKCNMKRGQDTPLLQLFDDVSVTKQVSVCVYVRTHMETNNQLLL